MKTMARSLVLVFIGLFCMATLTACANTDASSTIRTDLQSSAVPSSLAPSVPVPDTAQAIDLSSIRYINYFNQGSSEEGYYYLRVRDDGTHNICYIDFATHQDIVLCNRLECTHSDETCNSWIGSLYNTPYLITANDGLLVIYPGNAIISTTDSTVFGHVDHLDFNGSNRRTIASFDSLSMFTNYYAITDDYLFYQLDVYDSTSASSKKFRIERLDLKTGERTTIVESDSEASFLIGASPSGLIITAFTFSEEIAGQAPEISSTAYLVNADTGEMKELIDWGNETEYELAGRDQLIYLTPDGVLHGVDYKTCQNTVLVDKPLQKFFKEQSISGKTSFQLCFEVQNKVVVKGTVIGTDPSKTRDILFYIDLNDETVHALSLTSRAGNNNEGVSTLNIACVAKEYLVVVTGYRSEVPAPGADSMAALYTSNIPQYALLSCENFFNNNPNYQSIQTIG